MENIIDLILRIITLAVIGLEIIFIVWTYIKTKTNKKSVEQDKDTLLAGTTAQNKILQLIPNFIKQAEDIFGIVPKTGTAKLMYVMQQLKNYCENRNLALDEDSTKNYIELILQTPTKKPLTTIEEDAKEDNKGVNDENGQIGTIEENF